MDDFNFWWYIIAAVIYFLTSRGKKKKQAKPSRPGTENTPSPRSSQPKSFEELLKEITEGRPTEIEDEPVESEPVINEKPFRKPVRDDIRYEGERRAFADDESKRVYEESIKMAEGADLKFETNEKFAGSSLLKDKQQPERSSFARKIMEGFDLDEAKKAVVYAEIFKRKY